MHHFFGALMALGGETFTKKFNNDNKLTLVPNDPGYMVCSHARKDSHGYRLGTL